MIEKWAWEELLIVRRRQYLGAASVQSLRRRSPVLRPMTGSAHGMGQGRLALVSAQKAVDALAGLGEGCVHRTGFLAGQRRMPARRASPEVFARRKRVTERRNGF